MRPLKRGLRLLAAAPVIVFRTLAHARSRLAARMRPPIADAVALANVMLQPGIRVHTNGCGDFTLLSREVWHRLGGYAEIPLWSMHLDSLLCYEAVASGCRQVVLPAPARMYHMEHASSWVALDLEERLRTFVDKPWLDSHLLKEICEEMFRTGEPLCYNGCDWGYGNLSFAETVLGSGTRATSATSATA